MKHLLLVVVSLAAAQALAVAQATKLPEVVVTGARATQDSAAMLRYQELIVALSPESAGDRIGGALLRLQNDDPEGGRLDLLWLLENRPRGVDLERVEQLLRSLR